MVRIITEICQNSVRIITEIDGEMQSVDIHREKDNKAKSVAFEQKKPTNGKHHPLKGRKAAVKLNGKTCPVCDNVFTPTGNAQRFCSAECRTEWNIQHTPSDADLKEAIIDTPATQKAVKNYPTPEEIERSKDKPYKN